MKLYHGSNTEDGPDYVIRQYDERKAEKLDEQFAECVKWRIAVRIFSRLFPLFAVRLLL